MKQLNSTLTGYGNVDEKSYKLDVNDQYTNAYKNKNKICIGQDTSNGIGIGISPDIGSSFGESSFGNWIQTSPYLTSVSSRSNYTADECEGKTVELKLIDGTMVIETFAFCDIMSICELEKDGRRYTKIKFKRFFGKEDISLDIDCKMSTLMRIIGRKYVPWNKTIMELSVKEGE